MQTLPLPSLHLELPPSTIEHSAVGFAIDSRVISSVPESGITLVASVNGATQEGGTAIGGTSIGGLPIWWIESRSV